MRVLTCDEVACVDGGIWKTVARIVGSWAGSKALDGAVEGIKNGEVNDDTFSSPTAFANVYGA